LEKLYVIENRDVVIGKSDNILAVFHLNDQE